MTEKIICAIILISSFVLSTTGSIAQNLSFDGYYNYLQGKDYPSEDETDWGKDVQGITHTDKYWFFSDTYGESQIFRIPVTDRLREHPHMKSMNYKKIGIHDFGFSEFKGIDAYQDTTGEWYIIAALQGDILGPAKQLTINPWGSGWSWTRSVVSTIAGVAVISEDLKLIGVARFSQQVKAGWLAIDASGLIYSAPNGSSCLNRYELDIDSLLEDRVHISWKDCVSVLDEIGEPLTFQEFQGADFAPGGQKLYIVTGSYKKGYKNNHGIHVIDVQSRPYERLRKSSQDGFFKYAWKMEIPHNEEPEDITFWDVSELEAPFVHGEMHVLLLDNDASHDDVYIKHYTRFVHVDGSFKGVSSGDSDTPFKSVEEASNTAYEDMILKIKPGHYPETFTIKKRLLLIADGGEVTIGR